jgi:hypothetical protein
MIHRSSEN